MTPAELKLKNEIIVKLKNYYQQFETELKAYTQEGVLTTPYASDESTVKPWAEILLGITDRDKQKQLAEFERTMTARYCFELLLIAATEDENLQKAAYALFIAAQKDPKKINKGDHILSNTEFFESVKHFKTQLNHPTHGTQFKTLLDYLVVYSDLAKTPSIKAWAKAHNITSDLGGDEIMRQILDKSDAEIHEILPSITQLNKDDRKKLKHYYPLMTACLGHLYFLEAGPKMLETIRLSLRHIHSDECQSALNVVIGMAQMLDMMGARGQESNEGSLTFTHNMHLGSYPMLEAMRVLDDAENIEPALNHYLQKRASYMGYTDYKTIYSIPAHSEVFMRLACKLRVFDSEKAQALKLAFDALSEENRHLLGQELSFNEQHGIDSFKTAPNYEATGFHNISRIAREITKDYTDETRLALNYAICFAQIIENMQDTYPEVCQSSNPVSFGKLAFLANEYPDLFNPATFSASIIIAPEQLQEKHKNEFGGKSFVDLTLPNGYTKPKATNSIATSLGNSLASITNLNVSTNPVSTADQNTNIRETSVQHH